VKRIIAVSLIVILSTLASLGMGTSLAESPLTEKVWEWTPVKYAEVLRRYDISEKDIETILRVLKCESSFVSEQSRIYKNGVREPSFGIAQIHLPSHPDVTKEQALDEEFSIHWTAKKWVGGFRSWSCYK
jgi:hypothetical protein